MVILNGKCTTDTLIGTEEQYQKIKTNMITIQWWLVMETAMMIIIYSLEDLNKLSHQFDTYFHFS